MALTRGGRGGGSNTNRQIAGDIFGQKRQKGTQNQSNEDLFDAKYVSLGYLTSLGLEYIIDDKMFEQL